MKELFRSSARRKGVWSMLALVTVVSLAVVALGGNRTTPSATERIDAIASTVRCPTCSGLSAGESDAKAATAVKAEIARRVDGGDTDAEIRQALVSRYGKQILLTPEATGVSALVWAVPVAGFVIANAVLGAKLLARRRAPGTTTAAAAAAAAADERDTKRQRQWKTPVLVAGVAVVALGGGWAVASTSGERLPGESATGTIDLSATQLLGEARSLLVDGQAIQALRRYDQVLAEDPRHPEALAYRGWLVRLAGQTEDGLALIDAAVDSDPQYPDARLFRGVILLEDRGDAAAAVAELEKFLALSTDLALAERGREVLARARAQLSAPL